MKQTPKNKLKELRKKHNLTLRDLEKRIGINYSVISRIESGDRALTDSEINLICDFFQVSSEYLLGRTDKPDAEREEISRSFYGGPEDITEDEREYLDKQLAQYRELKKQFLENQKRNT
ncbi:Helix-turn-helix [Evansella caseinilytica]|uniref:Helix-turn-helix n=1 Tax=Evansella caseinilytica TaxID=1503961 RepID=A0A1H3TLI1_9BACI|nr:helix-turn-helix transcriptional regulator [Evansella caseinilytica]SDZ51114.1 Helix-turn-helix [Evansella caseinilytica]